LDALLPVLRGPGREIHLRPHPQYTRRSPAKMQAIAAKYANDPDIGVEMAFAAPFPVRDADLLVTDWSGIAYEYAFTTRRPVLFVNTPMKVVNPEWEKIGLPPVNITFRDLVGVSVDPGAFDRIPAILDDFLAHPGKFADSIDSTLRTYFFNPGHAGEAAGRYILQTLINRKKQKGN
ncbi:MAG: preprotein translocase YidC, partial [Kiritimatiellae bacterium]|nr:preprotein translocase YidC [Kiritimatiellia bacterium]